MAEICVRSKDKYILPCLWGQTLDFSIFSLHKCKIFLLITFFKILRNDWAHRGIRYSNVTIKCQCAQSFVNILEKLINKKILYLCIENMLKSSFYSVTFNFFGPSLLYINVILLRFYHPLSGGLSLACKLCLLTAQNIH